jgi:hypothetical protein
MADKIIRIHSPRPVDVRLDSPSPVDVELGPPGKPGAPGPPGPDVGTPVVPVGFYDPWPPAQVVPGTMYVRLAP